MQKAGEFTQAMGNKKSREASKEEMEQKVPMKRVEEASTPIKATPTPHNFQAIMKALQLSPVAAPEEHLYSCIFFDNNTKKYWVDRETGMNCFALFARSLRIDWSDNPSNWKWTSIKETGDVEVEVASLLDEYSFIIYGALDTSFLTPKAKYEVAFTVMLEEDSDFDRPVNLRRWSYPGGRVQEESLQEKPRGQWLSLKVSELTMSEEQAAREVGVFLSSDPMGGKRGLVVKSLTFLPSK